MLYVRAFLWLVAVSLLPLCSAANEPLDINSASAQQIQAHLPGIGKVKAEAIVTYRERNGPFANAKQLLEVKGVGPQTLLRIKPLVNFGTAANAYSIARQNNLEQYDKSIKQAIRQIVTRAKAAGTNSE